MGRELSVPVAVTHFFSLPGRRPEGVVQALSGLGITEVVMDEELAGDGCWHVAAFTACLLTGPEAVGADWALPVQITNNAIAAGG